MRTLFALAFMVVGFMALTKQIAFPPEQIAFVAFMAWGSALLAIRRRE